MTDERPKKAPREEHLGDVRVQVRAVGWFLGPPFLLGLLAFLFVPGWLGTLGVAVVTGCGFAAVVYGVSLLLRAGVINPAGDAFGRILMPSGSSTPPPKPLSHIEAMAARGDHAKAAAAYKAEIESDPVDVTSCERLGMLALRELKDPPLALWAFREAEKRVESPARKFGFGLLVAGVYRDQLRDAGKTVVELRRLLERYPDAPGLDAVRAEIDELKAGMFGGPTT